ncbi:lipopolysaccharide biosynthesis protein [Pseudoalteromonas sp. S16_S37]|uniref:lipopolysaccharide biosynthesis protein n=1 Tax=Pseudoalteromonas sp. S16_S37 TaxID=2720228 RepID=UPI001680C1C2|nr:oligosaccharide flippase family protein [Pseudoalteromonas sp. S16_S37]MBD1582145.1 oligosaccharide flippase family protein [Pseudoalteromonas sp. S16_S37]
MSGLKQIAYYGIAVLVLKGLGFLMMPIVTRVLSQQEYGYLNFLVTVCAACSLLLSLGLPELIFKHKSTNKQEVASLVRDCALVSITCCSLLTLGTVMFASEIVAMLPAEVQKLDLYLLLVNLYCSAMLAIPYSYWRVQGNAKAYCVIALLHGVAQSSLTLLFLYGGLGVTGVMLSGAICCAVTMFIAFAKIRFALLLSLKTYPLVIKKADLYFLLSIVFSSICLYACNGAENWFIVSSSDTQTLAIYFVAAQFALMTSFAFEPIRMWWFAKRFEKLAYDKKQYGYETIRSLNLAILISMVMLIFSEQLIAILLPSSYSQSATWVTLLIVVVVLRHHADLLNIGCYTQRNAQLVVVINAVSALIMLGMMSVLVPKYLMMGAVLSLVIVHGLRALAFYFLSQMLEPVPYKLTHILGAWICMITLLGTGYISSEFITAKRLLILLLFVAHLTYLYRNDVMGIVKRVAIAWEHRYA